jgi:Spy/CpxP family protein refolding chaperone
MRTRKLKTTFYLIFSAFFILTFSNLAVANIMDSIGTGSAGSYDHATDKSKASSMKKEGSGSKTYSKHKSYSHKKEGSGGKKSHHMSKSYAHKKEGSGSKSYAHTKSHGYSKPGHSGHAKCPFTHLLKFKQELGLTEAQVSTIKDMRFEFQKKSIHFKAEKQIAKMEIDRLLHGVPMNESTIRAAGEKLIALKAQMIRAKIEAKISLLNVLTEDQRKKSSRLYSAH